MEENNIFGTRLKERRREKKLTQKQLADMIDAKHNSISDWENGKNKPDPDTIERICEALDISASYLLPSNRDKVDGEVEILHVSLYSGNSLSDDLRKCLHDLIDQLDYEDLKLLNDISIRLKKG